MHTSNAAALAAPEAMPKVRLVCDADVPALVAIGRELHSENGIMPYSERRVYETIMRAVNRDRMIGGVIGDAGDPEAVIFLTVGQFFYSEYPHLEELLAFVRPEYRRSNRAKALIIFAKQAAQELHVPLLIGVMSQQRTEAKARLYQRQLGKPAGSYFIWNGRTGAN